MEKYLEVIRTEKISIFAPITFIPCSECTPEEKKIQKTNATTKHCIECLKDKELACFDHRDEVSPQIRYLPRLQETHSHREGM